MNPLWIAILAMAAPLTYFVVRWLFSVDQAVIARRQAAAALSAKLTSYGLIVLPKMLSEYSTGDYVGLAKEIDNQVVLFLGPNGDAALMTELQNSFNSVLSAQLATPAGLALIQAKLAAATTPKPA